jgi:hypothetical protein
MDVKPKSSDGKWARRLVFYLRHSDAAAMRNSLRVCSAEAAQAEEMAQWENHCGSEMCVAS